MLAGIQTERNRQAIYDYLILSVEFGINYSYSICRSNFECIHGNNLNSYQFFPGAGLHVVSIGVSILQRIPALC